MILCVCPNPAIDKFIHIDNLSIGKVNRISKEFSYPGGKGIHVALGVRELGEEVALLSFWGGSAGKWIKQECEARGITCYGPEVEDWSRTCLTIKSNNNFNETEILGVGPMIKASEYAAFTHDYQMLLKKSSLVSMSGSWPENSVGANYSMFIEKATQLNKKSFLDCTGDILIDALQKKPYTVHINHYEGYDIYALNDPLQISQKLRSQCDIAAVTFGDKGLYLYDGKELVHAISKVENPISTVGCGDSLMAGLIIGHTRKYDLVKTAKLAAAAGAANCLRKDLGMFYKKDVKLLFDSCDVKVKHLD